MPTPTFTNLPAEKRDRLLALALAEFAANDYPSASISRIVSQAGIATGSLYQYFAGKRALYLHLVDLASPATPEAVFWAIEAARSAVQQRKLPQSHAAQ